MLDVLGNSAPGLYEQSVTVIQPPYLRLPEDYAAATSSTRMVLYDTLQIVSLHGKCPVMLNHAC